MIIHCLACGKCVSSHTEKCPYCYSQITEKTFELNGLEQRKDNFKDRVLSMMLGLVHTK